MTLLLPSGWKRARDVKRFIVITFRFYDNLPIFKFYLEVILTIGIQNPERYHGTLLLDVRKMCNWNVYNIKTACFFFKFMNSC